MKNVTLSNAIILRRQAEERLSIGTFICDLKNNDYENLKLIHELQVHQIELEIQNEELIEAKEITDDLAEKYIDLYNLAPLGYFTLTINGEINELNEFGSHMLGKESLLVENGLFGFYVIDEDKPVFNLFMEEIFKNHLTETCMVSMQLKENVIQNVLLTGNLIHNTEHCMIAAIDISERMRLEKESNELKQFNNYFIGRELRMVELKKEINDLLYNFGLEKKYPV